MKNLKNNLKTLSHYTGGSNGWGTLVSCCAECGEVVLEQECDKDGIPTNVIWDTTEDHVCPEEQEGAENEEDHEDINPDYSGSAGDDCREHEQDLHNIRRRGLTRTGADRCGGQRNIQKGD